MNAVNKIPKYGLLCIGLYILDILVQVAFVPYLAANYENSPAQSLNMNTYVFTSLRLMGFISIFLFSVAYYQSLAKTKSFKAVLYYSLVFLALNFTLGYINWGMAHNGSPDVAGFGLVSGAYPFLLKFIVYGTVLHAILTSYRKQIWLVVFLQVLSFIFIEKLLSTGLSTLSLLFLNGEASEFSLPSIWQSLGTIEAPQINDIFILIFSIVMGPFGILVALCLVVIKDNIGQYAGFYIPEFLLNTIFFLSLVIGLYLKFSYKKPTYHFSKPDL